MNWSPEFKDLGVNLGVNATPRCDTDLSVDLSSCLLAQLHIDGPR